MNSIEEVIEKTKIKEKQEELIKNKETALKLKVKMSDLKLNYNVAL